MTHHIGKVRAQRYTIEVVPSAVAAMYGVISISRERARYRVFFGHVPRES